MQQALRRKPVGKSDLANAKDVAGWIRDGICQGRYVPGQRLIEADLIRETGASRSHIRDAFQRLESDGLLVVEEFRGASVKQFSEEEARQIYRTRMALEGMAARDFAALGGADEKSHLRRLQERLDECEKSGNSRAFADLNDAWHDAILAGARNPYLESFVRRLAVPIRRMMFSTFYNAHRIDGANADHRAITKAIVEGRADEADRLMQGHIEKGLAALLEISRR